MALFGSKKKADDSATPAAVPGMTGAAPGIPMTPSEAPAPVVPAPVVKERKVRTAKGAVRNGTIVGLNIGNALIKAVEVTAKNGEVSVTRAASVPTPPDAFQNGNVLSVSALANAIKALWKVGGFKGKAVISSVAGTGALVVRVIEVPLMTDAQLADAMRADAQLYIPFPPTEVQMDFKALRELPSDPDSGTMDVLLAAAQSEIIDLHIKTLQTAKLSPRAVDVEPIAAGRTLALQKRGDFNGLMVDYNEITAVANIGAFGTEISLLRGDILVFTRTVTTGGNSISQGIADALGVPLVEGERIKIEQGDALPPEGYQTDQGAGDDFGFGDPNAGFGNDFDDFGLSDTPAQPQAPTNRTTVLEPPSQAPASTTDPFDLDFFNQGPKSEPEAGHGQKEGEPNPQGGPFSFDDFSLLPGSDTSGKEPTTPPATPAPTPAAPAPATFNFDFDMPSSDLPSAASATGAPTPPVAAPAASEPTPPVMPSSAPSPFDFDSSQGLSDDFLPSVDAAPVQPQAPVMPPTPIASAFDFSDFDLPTTGAIASGEPIGPSTPIAPASVAPVAPEPAPSTGFSFGDIPEIAPVVAAPEAAASSFNFGDVAVPHEENIPAMTSGPQDSTGLDAIAPVDNFAPEASGLDIGDVFGTPSAANANANANEGVSFDDLDLGAGPQDDGLNLSGVADQDDFGFGGDEFGGFGAGLSAGADMGSAAVYEALANSIEELAGEISRSLSFYLERVPDAALSRIYLTGGGALLKNLDVFLTGRLGAPTSVLNPLQLLPVTAQSEIPNGPLYTVALGLALRDFVD